MNFSLVSRCSVTCAVVSNLLPLICWAVCFAPRASSAEIIAQFDERLGFGFTNAPPPGFTYLSIKNLGYDNTVPWPTIFEEIRISSESVGKTYTRDAGTDADFVTLVSEFTNGVDDHLVVWHFHGPNLAGAGSGYPELESFRFQPLGNPDLIGYQITSIAMRINSFTSDASFDRVNVTFTFYGVPELGTGTLLTFGSVALCFCRRRTPF